MTSQEPCQTRECIVTKLMVRALETHDGRCCIDDVDNGDEKRVMTT